MAYSKSAIRVAVSILMICLSHCSSEPTVQTSTQDIDDTVVSDIMKYVQPYFKTFQVGKESFYPRADDQSIVVKAINEKIKQLKPFFDDSNGFTNREMDDHLELEGADETTIVEFVPKPQSNLIMNAYNQNPVIEPDSFQTSIRKYKKMRNRIKLALEKETTSKKTKKMVIQTVDEMIARLVESKCPWNDDSVKSIRSLELFKHYTFYENGSCYAMSRKISDEECVNIKRNVTETLKKFGQTMSNTGGIISDFFNKIMSNISQNPFFNMFSTTVTNVFKDSQTIADKYKVRCSVIDLGKSNKNHVYSRRSECEDFRLCTDEFRGYLLDLYKSLNDTAVSVFGNYAAMYQRDVNADESDEKQEVVATITNASNSVADEIIKLFVRETSKIKLTEKGNKEANMAAIKEFVRKTIKRTNKRIEKHTEEYVSNLRERTIQAVKKDITVNMGVDLGNLESHFLAKLCSLFVTCNGEVARSFRKRYQSPGDKEQTNRENRVFVKVQLTLDDELKNTLVNKHRAMLRSFKYKKPSQRKHYELPDKSVEINSVTRTTRDVDTTKLTTDIESSDDENIKSENYNNVTNITR